MGKGINGRVVAGVAAVGAASCVYAYAVERHWLEVKRIDLPLPRLPPAFDGFRIAQVSDFHIDCWTSAGYLDRVVDAVNAERPGLIALTGDYITRRGEGWVDLLPPYLRRLQAREGIVAVLGNHDWFRKVERVRRALREGGARELANDVLTLNRGASALHLAGVDDVAMKQAKLDRVLERIPAEGCAVLLAHEPDFADAAAETRRFDLQLSGHSHGGQVRVPFLGPVVPTLPLYGRKYHTGLYRVGTMLLYANRGVGTVMLPIRFNCRPEVTIFTLRSPAGRRCGEEASSVQGEGRGEG